VTRRRVPALLAGATCGLVTPALAAQGFARRPPTTNADGCGAGATGRDSNLPAEIGRGEKEFDARIARARGQLLQLFVCSFMEATT